jgi:hypothetical protein
MAYVVTSDGPGFNADLIAGQQSIDHQTPWVGGCFCWMNLIGGLS